MSGYGKRRLSLETVEEPSTKRAKFGLSDVTGEALTNGQDNSASYPTYMTQPQPLCLPQATPSPYVFRPEDIFQLQHVPQSQPILQPQAAPQPQHGFQPRHGFQPPPVPCPQSTLQPQSILATNTSIPRHEDEATDIDSVSEDEDEPEQTGPSIPSEAKGKRRATSPAPEEPNAKKGPSARSQRRAGMKNPGRDDRERDEVQDVGGQLFWRDPKTGEWRRAVYHNDIRAELIAAASALGAYTHQRKRGTRAHDETAFHPEQRDWTPERQHCKFSSQSLSPLPSMFEESCIV